MGDHWTEFFAQRSLYAEVLESFLPQAAEEAAWAAGRLGSHRIEPGSHVLDLACGIGRHGVELARLGYRVTGVDLSPAHVERAQRLAAEQEVAERTAFRVGDMREVARLFPQGRFDAVINLSTSFGFYDDGANARVLEQCRELTRDGGLFLMDTINRDWLAKHFQLRGFQRYGGILILEERSFDPERGRVKSHWTILREAEDGHYRRESVVDVDLRVYTLGELVRLFERAGWSHVETHGSLVGAEFGFGSRRIVALFIAS